MADCACTGHGPALQDDFEIEAVAAVVVAEGNAVVGVGYVAVDGQWIEVTG